MEEKKSAHAALTIDRAAFLLLRVKKAFKKKKLQRKEKERNILIFFSAAESSRHNEKVQMAFFITRKFIILCMHIINCGMLGTLDYVFESIQWMEDNVNGIWLQNHVPTITATQILMH
ncbi:hypothetical protein CBL_14473 [Carabus blaptoides fortunei]